MVRTISRGKDPALQQLYTLCIGCSRTFCAIWCRGSHVVKYKGFITACTLFIYLFFLCESKYMQPQSLYTLLYPTFFFFFSFYCTSPSVTRSAVKTHLIYTVWNWASILTALSLFTRTQQMEMMWNTEWERERKPWEKNFNKTVISFLLFLFLSSLCCWSSPQKCYLSITTVL